MSDPDEFFKISEALSQFDQEEKYADVLSVATKPAGEYPEQAAGTAFGLIGLQNQTGQSGKALLTFKDTLTRGVWWAEFRMREASDLDALQGNREFERLVRLSAEMHVRAEAGTKPGLVVHQPEGTGPFPLLIDLGPRGGYPELDFRDWSAVIQQGWMLVLPQSAPKASPLAHAWDDRKKALNEIAGHFETLTQKCPVDVSGI